VSDTPLLFSIRSYDYMQSGLAHSLGAERGEIERQTFPDGEHYMRLRTSVVGRRVVLVGGTVTDADTLELYDLASAIVKYGARSLSLLVPYFGYATMERAVKTGEVVTAKTRARLLSSIPNGDAPNRIVLFDVHTEGLPYYFEGTIVPVHVYGKPIVTALIDELTGGNRADLVLACTDAGRAKWVQSLANDMGVFASFVFYDDMIRTGGSLLQAAKAYRDAGAKEISAVTTHGLFPGDSLQKIERSGLLKRLACTDSVPQAQTFASAFLRVAPTADLFATVLREHL
jgi:ribose-phosphate pyrophosphokinase